MDKQYIWLVGVEYSNGGSTFTSFDNKKAAYKMYDYLTPRTTNGTVWVQRMPVYHEYIIIDDNIHYSFKKGSKNHGQHEYNT